MFALYECALWIALDLSNGCFYIIEPIDNLIPFDTVEIIENNDFNKESQKESQPKLLKKYNYLQFGGYKKIQIVNSTKSKKIFGIIDYTNKIQYGKKNNKFLTLFKPLSFSTNGTSSFLIKTNTRLNHNVYAISEQEQEPNQGLDQEQKILKCIEVCGKVNTKKDDIMSPFYATNTIPKKWNKPLMNEKRGATHGRGHEHVVDLTDKCVFSIDGDSTLDIDDAIHYEFTEDGFHIIGIHIADVADFFYSLNKDDQPNFLKQLAENVSSIYPDGTKMNMISKEVGETDCSLMEGSVRNVISVLFKYDSLFQLVDTKMHPSTIINRRKMTYKQVDTIFTNKKLGVNNDLHQIRLIMDAQPTTNNEMNHNDTPDECISRALIAKLMMLYNSHIAKILYHSQPYSIIRVHYKKNDDDSAVISPSIVQPILQRMTLQKGYYRVSCCCAIDEVVHSSLGINYYTHATSPIRRFVDFWNQLCFYNMVGVSILPEFNICSHIHYINWKQTCLKRAYEMMNLVTIFHLKEENLLDSTYEGIIIGIDDGSVQIFLPKHNKIFRFNSLNESMSNIVEHKLDATNTFIEWIRRDTNAILRLDLYQPIICRIIIRKNKYDWKQKVGIELIEPSFSEFLMD